MVTFMSFIKNTPLRPAIAMLELIFALVIMGISLLSVPTIVTTASKSINVSLQQEAINVAGGDLALILTYPWDEADANITVGAGVLRTKSAVLTLELNRTVDSAGVPFARRYNAVTGFIDASTTLGSEISDSAFADDVDDNIKDSSLTLYAGETANLSENEGEYIDQAITIDRNITYGSDATPNYIADPVVFNNPFTATTGGATSNIKIIAITLTTNNPNPELQKKISLSAFSCNIGVALPRVVGSGH